MLPDFPRLTRHVPACCQISPYSQTLTRMLLSPCQTHLTLSCMLPDSRRITDTLLLVSKLYRLNCASRSMLLQVTGRAPQRWTLDCEPEVVLRGGSLREGSGCQVSRDTGPGGRTWRMTGSAPQRWTLQVEGRRLLRGGSLREGSGCPIFRYTRPGG